MVLLNCGLCIESEPELERLFGLRSSSERDRLMGRVCIVFERDGVLGACLLLCGKVVMEEGSLTQGGTGGRVWFGDTAIFLDGCGCGVVTGWA